MKEREREREVAKEWKRMSERVTCGRFVPSPLMQSFFSKFRPNADTRRTQNHGPQKKKPAPRSGHESGKGVTKHGHTHARARARLHIKRKTGAEKRNANGFTLRNEFVTGLVAPSIYW